MTSQFPLLVAIPPAGGTVMVAADATSTAAYLNSPSQLYAKLVGFEDMTLSQAITPPDGLALTYLACIGSRRLVASGTAFMQWATAPLARV